MQYWRDKVELTYKNVDVSLSARVCLHPPSREEEVASVDLEEAQLVGPSMPPELRRICQRLPPRQLGAAPWNDTHE